MRKLIAVVVMAVVGITAFPQSAHANEITPSADEQELLSYIQGLRNSQGLPTFVTNDRLFDSARNWTVRMAEAGTISHNDNLRNEAPQGWRKIGENVAMASSIKAAHDNLVKSPAHYANLTDSQFNRIGLGVVRKGAQVFVTQTFAALSDQASAAPKAVAPAEQAQAPQQAKAAKATKARKAKKSRQVRKVRKARATKRSNRVAASR